MEESVDSVCLNHIAEFYLYEYYIVGEKSYKLKPLHEYREHISNGYKLMEEGDYSNAVNEWLKALDDNPVSVEVLGKLASCYKYLYDIEKEYEYTVKAYDYCCTRAEMAAYYRNLGWYYLEKYKPEVSVACYKYSGLFVKTDQVYSEIHFLEAATQKSFKDLSVEAIQKILVEESIPIKANSVTLALIYKAGLEAYDNGNIKEAYECFCMVYDLTQDEEVEQIIKHLELSDA